MVLDILLIVAIVGAGLGSGIFLAFSAGVMPGLRRASDETYVTAMREINIGVVNPAFLLPLFVPPFLLIGAAIAAFVADDPVSGWLLVVAAAIFVTGGTLLTSGRSIPLNNALEKSRGGDATKARTAFDRPWTIWNHVRTVLTLIGFALAVVTAVLR